MQEVIDKFLNVRVKALRYSHLPNKPLLLLVALGRCWSAKGRLAPFREYEDALQSVASDFGSLNAVYPFGRLSSDGVWEVQDEEQLYRNASGDLLRSELIGKGIVGGFSKDLYEALSNNRDLTKRVITALLDRYIPREKHELVIEKFGLPRLEPRFRGGGGPADRVLDYGVQGTRNQGSNAQRKNPQEGYHVNTFISYLNTLHNLGPSGANALAESQALSPYFGELYVRLPVVDKVAEMLSDGAERVVVLTGHAGDGKSTLALDVLKTLRGLLLTEPLSEPLREREEVDAATGRITIVKDMSELSAEKRQQWLAQAFTEAGSWLIVSNTGPLLNSLVAYAEEVGTEHGTESALLRILDQPLGDGPLDKHRLDGFGKDMVVLNLTRLDNVEKGAEILTRLVNHSGWGQCAACDVEPACPLALNRAALHDAGTVAVDGVRWIYRRLTAYEHRLTLRQIVAQLAFGLTGGIGCAEARECVLASTAEGADRGSPGLERILFSEGFFGFQAGRPLQEAGSLRAVALTHRGIFGAPVGTDFERRLPEDAGLGWATLPAPLEHVARHWRQRTVGAAGVRWRFALRRMAYLFGKTIAGKEPSADIFLNTFLQSPSLRQLDGWQNAQRLMLSAAEKNRLVTSCLHVLLENFSGFSAGQFKSRHEALYLTLCRPDRAVVQPTQLVLATLPFRDFTLRFDPERSLPVLNFGHSKAELCLTLPLLDYIRGRAAGELGNQLSPIHQAELDRFQAALLDATVALRNNTGEIELLRAGIDGEVHLHRFILDPVANSLEIA